MAVVVPATGGCCWAIAYPIIPTTARQIIAAIIVLFILSSPFLVSHKLLFLGVSLRHLVCKITDLPRVAIFSCGEGLAATSDLHFHGGRPIHTISLSN
jgi:hypothetical protein